MKNRKQIEREIENIIGLMQTEIHGDDPVNAVNAKAWAMVDALSWVLQKRGVAQPSGEIKQRMTMWQKAHGLLGTPERGEGA